MATGVDDAANAFANEVAPASVPRDHRGEVIETSRHPEPMFELRAIEGDPLTGDMRDGGDDDRLRARERRVADGWSDERQGREQRSATSPRSQDDKGLRRSGSDGGYQREENEQSELDAGDAEESRDLQESDEGGDNEAQRRDAEGDAVEDAEGEDGEKFEVVVDGAKHQVTLSEALRGYVRQATFHNRMTQLEQARRELDGEKGQLQQAWAWWSKARADLEEDIINVTPREPNWDQEFAVNPAHAHETQKIYQAIYNKLAQSQAMRAQREAVDIAERDRQVQKYAVDGFEKFVMANLDELRDEQTLQRNLRSMRRTALALGFSEYEIATVFDPRMLGCLYKASRFDRMTAAPKPRAVVPGKGKTLTPGAATPFGNVRRKGFDDAQRKLAQSGKLSDAVEVFRRIL